MRDIGLKDFMELHIDKSGKGRDLNGRKFTDTLHNCLSNAYYILGIAALALDIGARTHARTNVIYIHTYLILQRRGICSDFLYSCSFSRRERRGIFFWRWGTGKEGALATKLFGEVLLTIYLIFFFMLYFVLA